MTYVPLYNSCHLPPVHARAFAFLEHAIPVGVIIFVLLLILGCVFRLKNRTVNISLIILAVAVIIMMVLYFFCL